jgi:hypothetical protein
MTTTSAWGVRIFATGFTVIALASTAAKAQQKMPETTSHTIAGTPEVTTEQLHGTVLYVEGNRLVVRMANGQIREFDPPESRKFVIDGKELSVGDLKPGTKLTGTITTTKTPVTERTRTVGTGKVWWINGRTVILTLPNGENKTYTVQAHYKFIIDGRPADVSELRKGMTVSAEKIVEVPRTEIASNTTVVGQAPPPPQPKAATVVKAQPAPAVEPAPAPVQTAQAHQPPAPAEVTPSAPEPKQLPHTGSQIPLVGLLGLILTFAGLGLRKIAGRA